MNKPVKQRVASLVAAQRRAVIHLRDARNFLGQVAVPEFPAKPLGQRLGDHGAAAAIFAFDGDDADRTWALTQNIPLAAEVSSEGTGIPDS